MRMCLRVAMGAAVLGLAALTTSAVAEQKTAKECRAEWQANKADYKAKGITQKAYVAQCRGEAAATQPSTPAASPAAAPASAPSASQKTVKDCQAEWRANKAAYRAAKVSEKAYVEKCRAGEAVALPEAAPTSPAPAAPPAAPAATPAAKPAPKAATPAPSGANQFASEAQAKSRCPADTVVWVNLNSKIYHFAGHRNYGTTEHGAYMCEKDANADGFRASKTEKQPGT